VTRPKKVRQARGEQTRPRPWAGTPRSVVILALVGVSAAIAAGVLLWQSGDGEETFSGLPPSDPGPVHVHGLGVDPADDALLIATHTGLYRVDEGKRTAERVGDRLQDTMGFTVVGPNRFLGSGHPDLEEAREQGLPPLLGLIESTDAGQSWEPISLAGEADFHVLRFAGDSVYGYDSSHGRLMVSEDRGRTWRELDKPGPIVDLAVDPGDSRRIVVAAASELEQGLYVSRDSGRSWQRVGRTAGLLAWPASGRLYLVVRGGLVFSSRNAGVRLDHRGEIGGEPAAFLAQARDELYVALHDGTIKRSADGGRTWAVRSTP
jgi:Sortilin, neurotensin receptor 3,